MRNDTSAVGEIGGSYARTFGDFFALEGGVGVGYTGLQLSVMPKLRLGNAHHHFIAALGPSLAVPIFTIAPESEYPPPMFFGNAEVGYEYRSDSGIDFQITGGVTTSLTHTEICTIDCGGDIFMVPIPTVRFGFGEWF